MKMLKEKVPSARESPEMFTSASRRKPMIATLWRHHVVGPGRKREQVWSIDVDRGDERDRRVTVAVGNAIARVIWKSSRADARSGKNDTVPIAVIFARSRSHSRARSRAR